MALGHRKREAVVAVTLAVERAWPSKPSQTIDTDVMPMDSAAIAACITAGVQEPQHPMPEMTASTPRVRRSSGVPDACLLVAAEVAEDVVADDVDAGEPFAKLGFQHGEQLVTAEQVVPQEGDTGALDDGAGRLADGPARRAAISARRRGTWAHRNG